MHNRKQGHIVNALKGGAIGAVTPLALPLIGASLLPEPMGEDIIGYTPL